MQRKWRRAWLRGKPHYMRYKPVRKARTGSIKAKVYDLTIKAAKKFVPAAAAAGIFLSSLTGVQANPTGGSITVGTGSITGQGTNHVTINQHSDKLAVNWNSFGIGSGEKVQFIQPGVSSIALNRVLGNNASVIYGQLSANGKVFLLNPNGVLFAQGAQVNVGGLVASTLKLSDQDFMNSKYSFSGDSQQGVLNQGNITATNGGYVALLGANAANEGVILAKEGTVALGAGSKIALDFTGDGLLTLSVDESKVKAEVKNSGLIKADGGLVIMNAKAADALTGSVVNNTGTIEAKSVTSKNGAIILTGDSVTNAGILDASGKNAGETGGLVKVLGDTVGLAAGAAIDVSGDQGGGTALVGGAYQGGASEYAATKTVVEQGTSINADAIHTGNGGQVVVWANDITSFAGGISAKGGKEGGDGGSVETSGKKTLTVADTASVNTTAAQGKTGNWLLDPADFVVDATGAKGMTAAALSAALQSSGVTITTTADTASSTTGATNTDTSGNGDITINSAVSWSADSKILTLNAHRNININANVIASGTGAGFALSHGTGGAYKLGSGAKITLSGANAKFTLNGSDYSVINSHSTGDALTALQNIKDNISGNYFLGEDIDASATSAWNLDSGVYYGFDPIGKFGNTFKGRFDGGGHTISRLTINRPSSDDIGLFGFTGNSADIRNVRLDGGSVTGRNTVGGLVGYGSEAIIENSYNSGSVSGSSSVGGLVGWGVGGSITNSYNSGIISGSSNVGGLAGTASGSITNSYNRGSITGSTEVGGLVGRGFNGNNITNSYNSGNVIGSVIGTSKVGGLVGSNAGKIENSYNSGIVSGSSEVGGLVGNNNNYAGSSGRITNSYNSGSVTGDDQVGGLIGCLSSGKITNSYNSGSVNGTSEVGGLIGHVQSGSIMASFYATTNVSGGSINNGGGTGGIWGSNSYGTGKDLATLQSASFWTSREGAGAAWSENMDTVGGADKIWRIYDGHTTPLLKSFLTKTTVNAENKIKTYDGIVYSDAPTNVTYASGTKLDLLLGRENPTYGKARNAGTYGFLYSSQHGYDVVYETGMLTIEKANLTFNMTGTVTKTYDGNNSATLEASNYNLAGLVSGDTVNVSGTVTYDDKNVGTGKPVTASNLTLGSTAAANYNLTSSTATANIGTITPRTLTTYLRGSVTKTYDGSNSATLAASNYYLSGLVGGDTVTVSGTATYNNKNAGTGTQPVTASDLTLGGVDASNYSLASSTATGDYIGNIGKAALTITATANTKTYDGTTTAAAAPTYSGLQTGDSLTNLVAVYADKNAGSGKTLKVNDYTLTDGNNGGNYTVSLVDATGSISQRQLTAIATAQNKVYDGNKSATVTGVAFDNLVEGESLTASYTGGTYETKDVGNGIKVTVNGVGMTAGTDTLTANYLLPTEVSTTAAITQRQLTAAATAQNKVYDGTTNATISNVTFGNLVAGETLTAGYTGGAFNDKHVGDNKTITVSGLTMTVGADTLAGNYLLPASVTSNAAITPAALAITATQNTKTYDGTTTAAAAPTYSGLQEDDSLTGLAEAYTDKNAGSGKTLQVSSGYTLNDGNNGSNYTVSLVDSTGSISQRQLTAVATAQDKTYDGTTAATVTGYGLSGFVGSETVVATSTAANFSGKDAGADKTVTIEGISLGNGANGGLASNYTVAGTTTTTATIDKATLSVTAKNAEKVYDKLAYEDGNDVTFDGFVSGETSDVLSGSLTYGGTAQGATEIGTYTLTPAGLTSTNYTITFRDGTLTIQPSASPNPNPNLGPGYIAAVQNRQQSTVNNTAGTGENHAYPPANAAPPQLPAGQASSIQYSSDTTGTPRVITTAGQTVTIAQDSLLQLATNPVQNEIGVYQTINGSSALAGVYQVDGSQGSLTLRKSEASLAPVPPAMPAPAAAQAETASFQLTDRQGNTANFTVAYTNGSLYVQAANAPAAEMLSQNRQLVTATSLVAVQDKLGLDINNLQAVHLVK